MMSDAADLLRFIHTIRESDSPGSFDPHFYIVIFIKIYVELNLQKMKNSSRTNPLIFMYFIVSTATGYNVSK